MRAGDREIRTRNADFDLRRYGPVGAVSATLTVRRGQAEVGQVGGKDDARILGPGDQMSWIDARPAAPTRKVDPEVALAWESHRLIYDHTPLSAVVTDLNRYVDRPITIAQPSVAALPFTGVLALDSEDRMLKRLQAVLPVQAQALPAAILLKPRSAAPAACAKGKPCAKPPLRAPAPRQ
jgi:transmembrane sensor